MIITTTEKYNTREATKLFANNNLMAKKRKLYLYKRSASLEEQNVDAPETGNATPMTSQQHITLQTQQYTSASTSLSSSASVSSSSMSPSNIQQQQRCCCSTSFVHISRQPEHLEDMQHQMLEDCGIQVATVCTKHLPTTLNSQRNQVTTSPPPDHCLGCSCTNNCHNCYCSSNSSTNSSSNRSPRPSSSGCCYRLTGEMSRSAARPSETIGKQQQKFASKNSYYLLSETAADVNDVGTRSNKAQRQHCWRNILSCSCLCPAAAHSTLCTRNTTTPSTHISSSSSTNSCCCRQHYLTASTVLSTTSVESTSATIKLSSKFVDSAESSPTPSFAASISSLTNGKSFSKVSTQCRSSLSSSSSSSLSTLGGYSRQFLLRHLKTPYAIFKMLLALMAAALHSTCPPYTTSSSNKNNRQKQQQPQQQQQPYYPQMEQRLMTHFNNNNTNNINSYNDINDNNPYHLCQREDQRQQHDHHPNQHHHHSRPQKSTHEAASSSSTPTPPPPHRHHHSRRQMRQVHHHHSASPNRHVLPNLNTLLIILSFLSLFFVSSSQALSTSMESSLESALTRLSRSTDNSMTSLEPSSPQSTSRRSSDNVRLSRPETVCKSIDIRNSPQHMRQLANCTVIEGFLLISLINGRSFEEYNETFPLLTEVTDYIIVFQVYYLRSLGQIFPNLSVIRGRELFEGYALFVYSNAHIEELGLSKLTTILRGGVRIEKNDMLCFVKTVDWSQIVVNNTEVYIENNRDPIECPSCPGDQWNNVASSPNELVCKQHQGRRNCWNSKSCQKFCPERCRDNCVDENTCCNEDCLGGCSKDNVNDCVVCRNFSINHTNCTEQCPSNYYSFLKRRCLKSAEECLRIGSIFENSKQQLVVPYNGSCATTCPNGYVKDKEKLTCVECKGKCVKTCEGALIDGAGRAKEMYGCNIIKGSLTIIIKRATQIMADLAYGLSQIEVITGYLKVQGTYGLFNLHFLKNLKTIQGKHLFENKYAFYVLENTDMESIWNPNQTVMIENGTVYFHFNPKLCRSEIQKLLPMLVHSRNQTDFHTNEVAEDSNGSKGSCNTTLLEVVVPKLGSTLALINITNPIKYDDERTFIGYQFLYMEDPIGNASKYGFRPCDDGWSVSEPTKETIQIFQPLKPFTQYAFYVKTMTISTERRNGQSAIMHFTTKSDKPSYVSKLQGHANSSSEIVMSWKPPKEPNGKLIKYKLRAHIDERGHQVESRNYCKDPLKVSTTKVDKPIIAPSTSMEEPEQPPDCKCPKNPTTGGTFYNEDEVEPNIHASIELENQLHNFIYVKKAKRKNVSTSIESENKSETGRSRRDIVEMDATDSFMLRHIREAPASDGEGTALQETKDTPLDLEKGYYEIITSSVNASTHEFVFSQLKHFSWYMLGIEACREPEKNNNASDCSREVKIYVRTLMLADVDKVEKLWAVTEATNSSRTNVRLFWIEPEKPNGAVVSYSILYELQAPDEVEEKKCITEVDYIGLDYRNNGYVLQGLQSGNYSIRIRTNTLAGEGHFSEKIYVYIAPNTLAPGIIAGIAIGSIVLILLIGVAVYLIFRKRILAPPSDLKMFPAINPHYISLQYIPDEWEVARDQIIQLSPLGQGSFGMVYEGILKGDEDRPCAIKTVNENATDRERMNFLNEACVMKQFDTYHVVRLLGVCSRGQPALVIMELMKNGDLKSYLRAHRPEERDEMGMFLSRDAAMSSQPPPLSRIYQMAIEIADGMAYLAAKKFVHRDLAARNCMVALDLTVKIGDFGMTRDIYENDYYRKGTKGLLPVRWMPPESLRDGVYSTASDVFSYGVVLWEMATLASQPYQGLANDQVLRYVIDGGVMERPENCPDKLYGLMQKCWRSRPSARPTFMEIIRYLYDLADPNFREVSFYNSEEGQHILAKDIVESSNRSGDVFEDPENDMVDVTTPLRLEEYSGYKLNMDNNSSVGLRGDSSMVIDDEAPHSPYSMGSPMVVSSTPDEQSRGSYNMSRILHPHSQLLNSAPSTSAGIRKLGSSSTSHQLTHPHTHPHHRNLYQPTRFSQQQARHQHHSDDVDAYVQPDFEPANEGIKRDSDEQGYEIYDPSPNYSEHVPSTVRGHDQDDEDDFGVNSTAAQNLLMRSKGRQKQPTIMPLSTSMPDDVIGQQAASSLHPSTASAASSNASSKAGTGKYQSLRAVADSLGSSIVPNRLRMMNMRLFNHKRSGSNASHKSTSSNPNSSSGVGGSTSNLARSGRGKSMSGQNLGTIESGGSGSAGSYCANPRFFYTSSNMGTSDNPNYKRLDDSSADTSMSGADSNRTKAKMPTSSAFASSSNPSYKMLDESLNVTGASVHAGENPNYEIMQPGGGSLQLPPPLLNETTSSYVMMNEPAQKKMPDMSAMHENDNPNYQLMCPLLPTISSATITPATVLPAATTATSAPAFQHPTARSISERSNKFSSSSSAASSISSHESEEDDDINNTKDIKLERMPLSRRSSNDRSQKKKHTKKSSNRSRSQSSSSSRSATTNTASTIIATTAPAATTTSQARTTTPPSSSSLSAKEKWWKEGQPQPPQPPPNGFVGREA